MSAEIGRLLDPAMLPRIMHAIRTNAFPNDTFPSARQPPTSDEIAEIKRRCAVAIVDSIPEYIRKLYFATKDTGVMERDVESMLDVFGDAYINKHLMVAALELLAVRLFPELTKTETVD